MIHFRNDILARIPSLWRLRPDGIPGRRAASSVIRFLLAVTGIRRFRNWRRVRRLRRRPGHFRTPGAPGLIRRLPWRWLVNPRPVSVGVVSAAVLVAVVMMSNAATVGDDASQIVRSVERERTDGPSVSQGASVPLHGKVALLLQVAMLQDALDRLDNVQTYTATFEKRERIDDALSGNQVMKLKIRHEPFSVYFKVEEGDVGREILYPISSKDQRMLVQLPKLGGNLPALKLEPNSSLAMSEARYSRAGEDGTRDSTQRCEPRRRPENRNA